MRSLVLLTILIVATTAGCAAPGARGDGFTPTNKTDPRAVQRDDIFQIVSYPNQIPWLERNGRIVGMRMPVYFISGETRKGAFVPGTIYFWVWELRRTLDGEDAQLVKVWEFDESEAFGYRRIEPTLSGRGYGFFLDWGEQADLEESRILVQVGYRRLDGRDILSPQREFLVPGRALGTGERRFLNRPRPSTDGDVNPQNAPPPEPDPFAPANPQPVFPDPDKE